MEPVEESKETPAKELQETSVSEQQIEQQSEQKNEVQVDTGEFIENVADQVSSMKDNISPIFELKDYLITQNIIETYAELNKINKDSENTDANETNGAYGKTSEHGDQSQMSSEGEDSYDENIEAGEQTLPESTEPSDNTLKRKGRGILYNHFKDRLTSFRLPKDNHDYSIDTVAYYYFDANKDDTVQCSACTRAYKPSTRVDTLIRHLSKKHGVTSNLFFRGPKQAFLAGGSIRPKPTRAQSQNDLSAFIQPVFNPPHPSSRGQSGMEEAVITWILSDSLPLNIVESPQFTRLMRMISPNAQLPSVDRLREILKNMLNSQPTVDNHPHPSLTDFEASAFLASFPVGTADILSNSSIQAEPIFEAMSSETFLRRPGRPPKKKNAKVTNFTESVPIAPGAPPYIHHSSEALMFRKSPSNS